MPLRPKEACDIKAGESKKATDLCLDGEAVAAPGTTGPGWMSAALRVVRFF